MTIDLKKNLLNGYEIKIKTNDGDFNLYVDRRNLLHKQLQIETKLLNYYNDLTEEEKKNVNMNIQSPSTSIFEPKIIEDLGDWIREFYARKVVIDWSGVEENKKKVKYDPEKLIELFSINDYMFMQFYTAYYAPSNENSKLVDLDKLKKT